MGLRLREIELEGFRAFKDRVSIAIGDKLTVLYGPPGSGKTSVLRALEYALFGSTREVRSRVLRKEDLINDWCEKARVRVVLEDGDFTLEVERVLERGGKERLRVAVGSSELLDERGEEYLESRLGVSLEEFVNEIAIGHLELYALMYSPPAVRGKLLDSMLGLGALERIYRELSGREVRGYMEALKAELSKLVSKARLEEVTAISDRLGEIEKAREIARRELENLRAERRILEERRMRLIEASSRVRSLVEERARLTAILESLGGATVVKAPRVSKQYVIAYAQRLRDEVAELLEDLYLGDRAEEVRQLSVTDVGIEKLVEALGYALEEARSSRVRLEYEVERARGEVEDAEDEVREIEDRLAEIESAIRRLEPSRWKYEDLIRRFGKPEEVARKVAQLEVKLKSLKIEGGRTSCIRRLQDEILSSLREGRETSCPVCGTAVVDPGKLPEIEPPERISREIESVEKQIRELRGAMSVMRRLEPDLHRYSNLVRERRALEDLLERRVEELEEARARVEELEDHLRDVERRTAELLTSCKRLSDYVKRLKVQEVVAKLEKIESELKASGYDEKLERDLVERIRVLDNSISRLEAELERYGEEVEMLKQRLERLKSLCERRREVESKLSRLEEFYSRLLRVRAALRRAHIRLRGEVVHRISEEASRIFKEINVHDEYGEVLVEVSGIEDEGRLGRGHYLLYARRIADDALVPVPARLSDGQKSLLALSLVLALSRLKERGVSFILLDDPIPNVDEDTKRALIRLLLRWSDELQVVLTTQSSGLAEELKRVALVYDVHELRSE